MRGYLMGVLCAAFLCSVVNAIGGEGSRIRRMICGIFMGLALLHPLGTLQLPELSLESILEDAEAAAQAGLEQARTQRNESISQASEAYILTKAAELALQVEAEVTVNDDGFPVVVTLAGHVSPADREALSTAVAAALGLGKEDVRWTEPYQSSE